MSCGRLGRFGFLLVVISLPAGAARASGLDAQRIVARKAVTLLPQSLAEFFTVNMNTLEERVIEPDTSWPHDRERSNRVQWHRVAMDVTAVESTHEARMAAARKFPRARAAARRLYRRLHKRGANGQLPWVIADHYEKLVVAFRSGDVDNIVRLSGYLTHFACDAAFPFAATVDHDGKASGNLHLGRISLGHPLYAHANVARRFEWELVRRNRTRYAEMIEPSPGDIDPVDEPVSRARSVLLSSLSVLDHVLLADSEILQRMEVTDGQSLLQRSDEYYVLLDQRCGLICRERMTAATAFAANLIGGAWSAAGKPALELVHAQTTSSETPLDKPKDPPKSKDTTESGGNILGSRHSQVFHYYNCTFAKKIAPDNLVRFRSITEALAQGRRPCRICNPK